MDVLIDVKNQKLRIKTNLKYFSSGTENFIRFIFNLTSDWNGMVAFAQFIQDGVSYNEYLDESNSVYLPSGIKEGNCDLVLYGSKDDIVATTNCVKLFINANNLIYDSNSTDITQPLYNQLVNRVEKDTIKMKEITQRLDSIIQTPSNDTEANSELIDIRVGADGENYKTAGSSIRSQFTNINNKVENLELKLDLAKVNEMMTYLNISQ